MNQLINTYVLSYVQMFYLEMWINNYRDELDLGHSRKPLCKYVQAVVMGDKALDNRAKLRRERLTPEEQVECLLNQATDGNILGRVYAGWEPWM